MNRMIVDLHTHTNASDGSLTPTELLDHARQLGVDVLSITDHDTLGAYERLPENPGLQLITGVELSTTWAGRGVHIVGLNVDRHSPALLAGIQQQKEARLERAGIIAHRLTRIGIPSPLAAVAAMAGDAGIGRPHFAQHLVDIGVVKDLRAAFKKYLGAGKPGDVKDGWASLEDVTGWIVAAGGIAVLAHPVKYKMTTSKLRLMLDDFVAAGGRGIEVISGSQQPDVTLRMLALADEFELAASCGSDFHSPDAAWSQPGRFAPLPAQVPKVWEQW